MYLFWHFEKLSEKETILFSRSLYCVEFETLINIRYRMIFYMCILLTIIKTYSFIFIFIIKRNLLVIMNLYITNIQLSMTFSKWVIFLFHFSQFSSLLIVQIKFHKEIQNPKLVEVNNLWKKEEESLQNLQLDWCNNCYTSVCYCSSCLII